MPISPPSRHARLRAAARAAGCLCALLGACDSPDASGDPLANAQGGSTAGFGATSLPGGDASMPAGPAVLPEELPTLEFVPDAATPLAVTTVAVPLVAGERLLGISAEGDLWLSDGASARAVDFAGTESPLSPSLAAATWAAPFSAAEGLAIVAGSLQHVTREGARVLPHPPELGDVLNGACGDPNGEMFVATGTGLWQREAGSWFQWAPDDGAGFGAVSQMADLWGACRGAEPELWFVGDGRLWGLDYAPAKSGVVATGFDGVSGVQRDATRGVGVGSADDLFVAGPAWARVNVAAAEGAAPAPAPAGAGAWATGGGAVWLIHGQGLYRHQADVWSLAEGDLPELSSVTDMRVDAAGAVHLIAASSVVRVSAGASIHVQGVRPWKHALEGNLDVAIHWPAGASSVALTLDGVAATLPATDVTDVTGVTDARSDVSLSVQGFGTHTLRSEAVVAGVTVVREVPFLVPASDVSWAEHVMPLFESKCAVCHEAGANPGAPDLASYDDWAAEAETMLERVGRGEMPPGAPLPYADVQMLQAWVEGGSAP